VNHHPAAGVTRAAIRTPRAAAVAGIVFAVLLTTSLILVRWALPTDTETAGDLSSDGSRRQAVVVALNLLPFAGLAFLWFIGVIRDRIGAGEDRFFATVFLGSGLLMIAMLFTCGAVAGGLLLSSDTSQGAPPPEMWSFARRVTLALLQVYAMRMAAVFTISTTMIAARLGLVPRWLAVFGALTGAVLLFGGFVPWLELIFPMWVFVLSVHILLTTLGSPPLSTLEPAVE
jgi:hypothetical protein